MLKMMKYEYKRSLFPLLVLLALLVIVEVLFVTGIITDKGDIAGWGMAGILLGAIASYLFVMINGIASYNNDLKNKYGYMVFMTPLSTYQIIGAKLLSTLLTGLTLVAAFGVLAVIDFRVVQVKYDGADELLQILDSLVQQTLGLSWSAFLLNILVLVLGVLLMFFTIITIAYLSISLASTVLQGKKSKGVVSAALFILIVAVMNIIGDKLPQLGSPHQVQTILQATYCNLPQFINYMIFMLLGFWGSAFLLNKKISL